MSQKLRLPACTFLRKLISPYGHGSKDAVGYRRPTNEGLIDDYNRRGYIRSLTNAQMLSHFAGRTTYYFWGDGRIKTPYALLCIDIDNHKVGSLEAALAFARYLKDNFFPNLYYEPSTGGKGVHGYVLIDKRGFGDERLHGLARMLDQALRVIHLQWQRQNTHLIVEGIEIKGHPPRITWSRDGQMKDLISGQFAKLPRQLSSRFEEFKKTTVVDSKAISQLFIKYKDEPVVSRGKPVVTGEPVVKETKTLGSLTGCVIKQADLDQWDAYLNVARTLVASPLKTKGREVATAGDMAVLLLILEACTNDMNDDGSMPTARIKENWKILTANGQVERPWCARRYSALRDHLSTLNHIEWEDGRYAPSALSPTRIGQAAKWRLTEAMKGRLAQEKLGLAAVVVNDHGEVKRAIETDLELVVLTGRKGEENLGYDKNFFIDAVDPILDQFIDFRQPRFIRPLLDLGVGGWRKAA